MNAIDVKDVHVSYRIINGMSVKQLFKKNQVESTKAFHAVKGVSFSAPKGSVVGIVGRNGSGKSTLLRAIGGVFDPDKGEIDLHGNKVSLLALGIGFHRELSGRENIFLSGLLMGMSIKEIQKKYDEIVDFSELGEFIDKPVSSYSSGMYSKLSFSIACIMRTDILLIDEVLSVGDIAFRKKSNEKLKELIQSDDVTVVLVSHNSATVRKMCDSVVWLDNGNVKMVGETSAVMDEYEAFMEKKK